MSGYTIIEVSKSDDGQRLDRWLKKAAPHLPYSLAQKLFRKGAIKIDGKKAKSDVKIKSGQKVQFPTIEASGNKREKPKASREDFEKFLPDNVIYEDKKMIAINKPAGLPAQGGTGVKVSVDDLLGFLSDEDLKLVHRIDKDTSGIMLLAKGRENADKLGKRFKGKDIQKTYLGVVVGVPEIREGKIDLPLAAKKSDGKIEKAIVDEKEGKQATTIYRVVDNASDKISIIELVPVTGRMHQLRVHMNEIGNPILGDGKYGGKKAFIHGLSNKMQLHAYKILLPNYNKKEPLEITAPIAPHIKKVMNDVGLEVDI